MDRPDDTRLWRENESLENSNSGRIRLAIRDLCDLAGLARDCDRNAMRSWLNQSADNRLLARRRGLGWSGPLPFRWLQRMPKPASEKYHEMMARKTEENLEVMRRHGQA